MSRNVHWTARCARLAVRTEDAVTWTVRVRGTGRNRAVAYARAHRFEIGRPVEFDAEADAVSALEYALGALAAELVNGFTALARQRRVEVDAVEAVVTGELNNPLTVLRVMGEDGHPGLARIAVKVYVATPAPTAVREVWRETQELSPLARTLRAAVALELALEVTA